MNTVSIDTHRSEKLAPELLRQILSLQQSLIATRKTARAEDGFLISSFSEGELSALVENSGTVYVARFETRVVGYLLITPINEFSDLVGEDAKHAAGGKFYPIRPLDYRDFDYLYQIGVSREMKGYRVGFQLLTHAKKNAGRGFLTDVLTEPVSNTVSLKFFEKNSFEDAGKLVLGNYRDFGQLESQVFTWKR